MKVYLTAFARKQLDRCPAHIVRKYSYWLDLIHTVGLREARKYKGFHDEALAGTRKGQRSVRLSKSYRVIYREAAFGVVEVILVLEVTKHEY